MFLGHGLRGAVSVLVQVSIRAVRNSKLYSLAQKVPFSEGNPGVPLRMLSHGLGARKLNWGVRLSGLRDRKLWLSLLVTSIASLSYLQGGLAEGQRRPPPSSSIPGAESRRDSSSLVVVAIFDEGFHDPFLL